MSIFKNMSRDDDMEEVGDRLGGGYQPFDSDIYIATIKALYAGESRGGALNLTLLADIDGREYRETIYISNREKQNFYVRDNKKYPLPGFITMDDLLLVATEQPLSEQTTEEKVINLYDFEQRKEVPTSVQMLTGAIGKKVALGILKKLENKREEVNGEWVDSAETREINEIDKVFHPELKVTISEAKKGKDPKFWDAWLSKNQGQVRDVRTIKDGQAPTAAPKAGAPNAQQQANKPRPSLFGK